MRRALQLARLGAGHTSPNPMVGAVIVGLGGEIIGEGWHRKCGEAHAEVNAVASVADANLLKDSTLYVSPVWWWDAWTPSLRWRDVV